jgi:hypothetical protein
MRQHALNVHNWDECIDPLKLRSAGQAQQCQ